MYYDKDNNLISPEDYTILINNAINYIVSVEDEIVLKNSKFSTDYEELKQELLAELRLLRERVALENVWSISFLHWNCSSRFN